MPLTIPNTITNGTPGDATAVQQNFDAIESHVNTELIARDGSVALTAALTLPSAPTAALHAATKAYVDATVPIGTVMMFGGAAAPTNYLFCRGQAVSRSTYAALFAIIGDSYGEGDGTTTFNLPNYQATTPVGFNSGVNPPTGLEGKFAAGVGERFGSTDSVVVSHQHTTPDHLHSVSINTGGQSATHTHPDNTHGPYMFDGAGATSFLLDLHDGGVSRTVSTAATTNIASNDHTHLVSGMTGASDRSLATTTTGETAVNKNIQPSLSINFMIKCL